MKLKEINWRKILMISSWCLLGAGLLTLLSFVNEKQQSLKCTAIDVQIDDQVPHDFIDEREMLDIINSHSKIIGSSIGSINISLLEKKIMANPYVEQAEVYSTIDGKLQVNVVQRDPMIRIITMQDEHFYIDRKGKFMPVSDRYSTPVIVANGYIFDTYSEMQIPVWSGDSLKTDTAIYRSEPILSQIYKLSQFLDVDTFWNAQLEQIYVNAQQEIELIPRVGNQRIILGTTDDLEGKFKRLYIFYTAGLNKMGWNNYSIINLKFKNQVVCTKINS